MRKLKRLDLKQNVQVITVQEYWLEMRVFKDPMKININEPAIDAAKTNRACFSVFNVIFSPVTEIPTRRHDPLLFVKGKATKLDGSSDETEKTRSPLSQHAWHDKDPSLLKGILQSFTVNGERTISKLDVKQCIQPTKPSFTE